MTFWQIRSATAVLTFAGVVFASPAGPKKPYLAAAATLVATHMDAVGHAELFRTDLRKFVAERRYEDVLLIPEDGEALEL